MRNLRWGLALGLLLAAPAADAAPDRLEREIVQPGIALLSYAPCASKAALCTRAGDRTLPLPSPPIASDGGVPADVPSRYRREAGGVWRVELGGPLRRPSWAGNLIFAVFDLSDPSAVADRRYAVLYQTRAPRLTQVAAELTLSSDDGIEAGRVYRIRVAQLISGKEVVLGEIDVQLE